MEQPKVWSLDEVKSVIFHHEQGQVDLFRNCTAQVDSACPTMIELGAAEGLYSVLFHEHFGQKPHVNICLEPAPWKIAEIQKNLPTAKTITGLVGTPDKNDGDYKDTKRLYDEPVVYSLQQIMQLHGVQHVDVLHVDIQGAELEVIQEIQQNNILDCIRFMFISTHVLETRQTYADCWSFVQRMPNKRVLYNEDAASAQGYGFGDGLIVVENLNYAAKKH